MKRFFACLILLLCLSSLLLACGDGEEGEPTIVGVWKSEELANSDSQSSTDTVSQRMIYAFAENGHMLSIDLYADEVTRVIGAHYALDEKGILTIRQFGKDDGEMIAELSGKTLTLSLNLSSGDFGEGEEDLSDKKITFTREKDAQTNAIVGSWVYAYIDENDNTTTVRYDFHEGGKSVRALYEGIDMENSWLSAHDEQTYTFQTVNGEELLYIFTESLDGSEATVELFRIGFPYDGYMTMEPLTDTDSVTEVLPFAALAKESE